MKWLRRKWYTWQARRNFKQCAISDALDRIEHREWN